MSFHSKDYHSENVAVEEWFSELQEASDCGPSADRGRVLASVRKMRQENLDLKEEQKILLSAYGFKRWGDLMRDAKNKVGKRPQVELPDVFDSVPRGWMEGDKPPSHFRLKNRLRQSLDLIKKVWAKIAEKGEENGAEWADEERSFFIEEFVGSTDPGEFEKGCVDYINDYEEKDPKDVWLSVLDFAGALERANNLPPVLVEELLAYAEEASVEVSKATADYYEETSNPNNHWLRLLITAYLSNESKPSADLVRSTWEDADYATRQGKLYDKENEEWDLTTSIGDLATAYTTYLKVRDEAKTHDDIAEAISVALGREVEATP